MPHVTAGQLQHMKTLLDLNHIAHRLSTQTQRLRGIEYAFYPAGDKLRAVMAQATHLQLRRLSPTRLCIEVIGQAIKQRMLTVKPRDDHFVPAVKRDLIQRQHQIFPHPRVAQRIRALSGHQNIQVAVMLERVNPDIDHNQHLRRHAGAQQLSFFNHCQRHGDQLLHTPQQVE